MKALCIHIQYVQLYLILTHVYMIIHILSHTYIVSMWDSMRIIIYTRAEFCVSLSGLSWCMVCLKHDPACLCRCHNRLWLGMCATQSRDGRRRCQLLDPVGIESDTGSTMEKQSRNAGVESEQTLKTFKHVANICSLCTLHHFGTYYHCRLLWTVAQSPSGWDESL